MQDTAAANEILKTVYEGGIRELIPTKTRLYDRFKERDAREWGGEGVRYPIKIGRNQGVGAYSERGALPTAGRQQYARVHIPMRYMGGRIAFSAQAMRSSEGGRMAFAPVMESETNGLINDLAAEFGRIIFGDGRGILALANGDPTTTTITLDAPGGVTGATNGARFINDDMRLTFVNPATGAIRASSDHTVVSVAAAGTTYTSSAAPDSTVEDNDYVVRAHKASVTDVGDTSYGKEPMGLLGLVDDGTYVSTLHGVNRTTYPLYQSTVISSVGALSADVIQRAIDLVDQRSNGTVNSLVMHHSTRRAYLRMMENDRRYSGGDLSRPDAGTVAARKGSLAFGGISIDEDKYCPYGMVFGNDESHFRRYVQESGKWEDTDGAILTRIGTGTSAEHSFEAFYYMWLNFHNEQPATSFRLDGVTATVAVAHVD